MPNKDRAPWEVRDRHPPSTAPASDVYSTAPASDVWPAPFAPATQAMAAEEQQIFLDECATRLDDDADAVLSYDAELPLGITADDVTSNLPPVRLVFRHGARGYSIEYSTQLRREITFGPHCG